MAEKSRQVFLWVGPVLAANWLSIAVLPFRPSSITLVGYMLGCLFAQATLAAAWTALGPAPLKWRLPLSLVWVIALPVGLATNMAINGRSDTGVLFILTGCLLGQWLVLQLPFRMLTQVFGLALRPADEFDKEIDGERIQFGIRHVLIVMVFAGVLLGVGRIIIPILNFGGEAPAFIFLVGAAMILTVPLLLAALMRRMAALGVVLALALTAVATAVELPLWSSVGARGPKMGHFIAINITSALMILVIAGIIRLQGYRLSARLIDRSPRK